jgi:hypothetical protein
MTHSPRPLRLPATLLALAACLTLTLPSGAQIASAPSNPVVGSSNTATADPPIPRPATTPCIVPLFTGVAFADFSPKPFTYAPPAACPGPWAKVVLSADFAVSAGRQFDRTAEIAIGHVNVYYGTTPEPSRSLGPSWHVERDLTEYGGLLRAPQSGDVNLGNLVNGTYTGIITGSARLEIYPLAPGETAPRAADLVLPLSTDPGGAALLATGSSSLAPTFNLPQNVEGAYLDLVTQSQSADEFWYTCVPDDVAGELFSCGGTAFREAEVAIDGQPAGVAPVYPWIFTGGIDPFLWRPIPGVQTLDFLPYRVDLTPFAGVLSNGQPHQVSVRVFNADNYFNVAASLLLYLDHGGSRVTGAVTLDTLAADPQPKVQENLSTAPDGTITGTVTTTAYRSYVIAGYAKTSHGRIESTVAQAIRFSNRQQFVVSATQYVQNIAQGTTISASSDTRGGGPPLLSTKQLSYPLNLDINFVGNADGSSAQTTTVDQRFESLEAGLPRGVPFVSNVSNAVSTTDTLLFDAAGNLTGTADEKSSQTYRATGPNGCYSRSLASVNDVLTSVVDGQGCGGHR